MSNSKNGKPRGFSYAIVAELILCMILINVFFLWWGLLQEDLTTKTFKVDDGQEDVDFDGYLFLNTLQSIGCVVVGIILIGLGTVLKCLYSCFATKSATSSSKTTPPSGVQVRKTFQYPRVMHHLLWIGFTQSIGPTFGMFAASYVSYPTVLVAKTTKMIPVMIVGFFLHKVRYPFRKVLVAMLITVGVTGFSFYSSIKTKRTTTAESSGGVGFDYGRGFGFLLLVGDLFFSAYTASTQDAVVQIMHYSSIPLMIWTNVFALFWQVAMMLVSEFPAPLDALGLSQLAQLVRHYVPPQLTPALGLCLRSATLTHTIVVYTICGVAGQMIVFYILARFGSVTLTATTVTRKVFGIVLSIVWNRHDLHWLQWVSLGPILAGVGLDFTLHGQKKKAGIKSSEKKKDR